MNIILKKNPVVLFCIATYLLSGVLILLNIFVFTEAQEYAIMFPQLAPGIIGITLTVLLKDDKRLISKLKIFHISKEDVKWFVLCLLVSIFMVGVSYIILSILNKSFIAISTYENNVKYIYVIIGIIVGSIGEEIGWRGFMLPELQLKYTPLMSSIILGSIWGIWHLNMEVGIIGFALFIITVIELSILFTWFYNKTKGSILIAIVFHAAMNVLSRFLLLSEYGIKVFIIEIIVFGICCILVLIFSDLSITLKTDIANHLYKKIPIQEH